MRSEALGILLVACSSPELGTEQTTASEAAPVVCAAEGPFAFYPPPEEIRPDVERAFAAWTKVAATDHELTVSPLGHQRIVLWPPSVEGFTAQWSPDGIMFVRPNLPDVYERVLHEAGHALGMEHVPFPGSVMCANDPPLRGLPRRSRRRRLRTARRARLLGA